MMSKHYLKPVISFLKVYLLLTALIAGWWTLAFKQKSSNTQDSLSVFSTEKSVRKAPFNHTLLSTIKRESLWEALSGNTLLMVKLMSEWDIDAQIMQSEGLQQTKRLPRSQYLRAQILGRQLNQASREQLNQLRESCRMKLIADDTGKCIDLKNPFKRFLPQTFAAASFLLALAPPNEIVALPRRLREQIQLYPKSLTNQIPLDCDRYNSEKLFLAQPQIAFIARYSHPATIQALNCQGIQLYTMNNLSSITEICDELLRVGNVINRTLEAELLKIFIEAAMFAIDNRVTSLNLYLAKQDNPRILFLNHHQAYSIPTRKTLTGQLLHRMGMPELALNSMAKEKSSDWMIPVDKEAILNLNPECLIIATVNGEALKKEIHSDPALNQLSAVRNNRVFFIDEAIQQTPSQFIVLAYHDLMQALAHLQ